MCIHEHRYIIHYFYLAINIIISCCVVAEKEKDFYKNFHLEKKVIILNVHITLFLFI